MKHYVYTSIILCCLACIALCAGCRSSYHHNSSTQSHGEFNYSGNTGYTSTGFISSKTTTAREEDSNWFRITYTFDTSKATDPTTGLPPISGYSHEGSQTKSQGTQEDNYAVCVQDSLAKTKTINASTHSTQEDETGYQGEVLSGIDKGINTGLSIAIPLALIIISYIIYVRLRKKNSSE